MKTVFSPSVAGLNGIFEQMNPMQNPMKNPYYISPLIPAPRGSVESMDSGYGISKPSYSTQLGSGISDVAATLNLIDTFFG